MKGTAKPSSIYFSAYPLKAVAKADGSSSNQVTQSPYLKAVLSSGRKSTSRARVFPMINPYKDPYQQKPLPTPVSTEPSRVPADIELTEKQWFHNYE
jgi:hypothetical protein